ncbi:DUF2314 domain-containing protein [Marinilabiliaceae bacterium JC017]|nr:DUF2314 domain-containing protein [Marinilabiliaceae bacterium JC017]
MGIFSKLIGKKDNAANVRRREGNPDVYDIANENDRMNWAIEKAGLILHYFEACLRTPKPGQEYFSIKVKIMDNGKGEHLWLTDPDFDTDGNLFGIVANEPIDVTNVKIDQKIGIDRDLVSDWMIIENGRLVGGYTIRAIREGLTGEALAQFDQSVGGMYIDEGEDYFVPDFNTPEGAILALEEAYDRQDLEEAMACKDFKAEARLMFQKLKRGEMDDEIIDKTAEVLRLSFMKSIKENGFPCFEGIRRAFPQRQKISDNHFVIEEVCLFSDGGKTSQHLNTYKTEKGWKVLNPED